MSRLLYDIREFAGTESCYSFGDCHHVTFKNDEELHVELTRFLKTKNHVGIELLPVKPSIEDCFIDLMN